MAAILADESHTCSYVRFGRSREPSWNAKYDEFKALPLIVLPD
jgi:hypothetical protein